MSKVTIAGDVNGTGVFTIAAPNGNTNRTLTLPDATGTLVTTASLPNPLTSGTAVVSTSGTSIDFTSIPAWVKRITVMFNEVSTNGSSSGLIQLGSGSFTTSGYLSQMVLVGVGTANTTATAGMGWYHTGTAEAHTGSFVITNITGNTWVCIGSLRVYTQYISLSAAKVSLSGTLDRIRITTTNGTDTFDSGSINIMYE